MRKTNLQVNRNHWNKDKGEIRKVATAAKRDFINGQLRKLENHIIDTFNEDHSKGEIISSDWLKQSRPNPLFYFPTNHYQDRMWS